MYRKTTTGKLLFRKVKKEQDNFKAYNYCSSVSKETCQFTVPLYVVNPHKVRRQIYDSENCSEFSLELGQLWKKKLQAFRVICRDNPLRIIKHQTLLDYFYYRGTHIGHVISYRKSRVC
jgi:hypothetical protein